MPDVVHWHPLLVHLPIGLWASVPVLLTAALAVRPSRAALLATAGSVNLVLGCFAALLALGSGLAAVDALPPVGTALPNVMHHVGWAVVSTFLFLGLTFLRVAGRPLDARPGPLFIAGTWLALLLLLLAGYYGGRNVYAYGLGVERAAAPAPAAGSGR